MRIFRAIFGGAVLFWTVSREASADELGVKYRGQTRCTDSVMLRIATDVLIKANPKSGVVSPAPIALASVIPLGGSATGKFSPWNFMNGGVFGVYKPANTVGPNAIAFEKTAKGTAGANALLCSFELAPGKKELTLVKESGIRMPWDANAGLSEWLVPSNRKEAETVYIISTTPESAFRSFSYKLSQRMDQK